jgi:chromatin structure-remodeling complex subunit RSC1/2
MQSLFFFFFLFLWIINSCLHAAKHFDRDAETNEVLWFAAPPLNIARKPTPRYSLQYLHWLATKRKGVDEERDDVEEESRKRTRRWVSETATEMIERVTGSLTE